MIVDASVHVWSAIPARYPWSPLDGVEIPQDDRSAERLLADLDAAGIDAAIAVQPRVYGHDHAYLSDVLRDHAARIAGIALVDPDDPRAPAAVSELARSSFTGIRLIGLAGTRDALAASYTDPVLAQAGELGMPVSLLVDPPRFAAASGLAMRHPDTILIIDHLGLCDAATAEPVLAELLALAAFPNVLLRLSALPGLSSTGYPFSDLLPLIRAVYQAFGGERLLWGTDYPHALVSGPYRQSLDAVRAMDFISARDLPAILGGTAARLFRLNKDNSK